MFVSPGMTQNNFVFSLSTVGSVAARRGNNEAGPGVECQVREKTNARSVTTGAAMFARTLKTVVTGAALVVGTACDEGPASCRDCVLDTYSGVARGANVVPPAADTTPRATVTLNTSTLVYTYTVAAPPAGTIDSIALYQVPQADVLPASATVILCAGAAACAAASGIARPVGNTTRASLQTSMRAYGTQLVVFTTTAQITSGGAMRGTMYPSP